jgi:threonine dehydrogenase-like Zn-dependent dehydrogenase
VKLLRMAIAMVVLWWPTIFCNVDRCSHLHCIVFVVTPGVHTYPSFPFSPTEGYDKNLTYCSGRCPARAQIDRLLPLLTGSKYDFTSIITHRMSLKEGVEAYDIFDRKLDGCIKVVLNPWD